MLTRSLKILLILDIETFRDGLTIAGGWQEAHLAKISANYFADDLTIVCNDHKKKFVCHPKMNYHRPAGTTRLFEGIIEIQPSRAVYTQALKE